MTAKVEIDCGIPLPGIPLPRDRWTSTAWHDVGRPFEWSRVFGRIAPRVLDMGCGDGRYLIGSAVTRPDSDHLGIELLRPLIDRALQRADRRGLTNLRFVTGDAVAWLFERLEPSSVDEIHVYHPQPYYDPAEVRLGMLTAEFFERVWKVLRREGLLVLQTDDKAYGRHLIEAARKHFDPEVFPGPWPDAPSGRTRREIVSRRKKRSILRVVARRREEPLPISVPLPYFDPTRPGLRKRRSKRTRGH
jgi:tRNA (guanine-N7-)-methyltransferase